MTVARMTREQRGIFVDMMAIAWDSAEPGSIDLSEAELCRELGIFKTTLRRLLADFPSTWRREGGKLVQPKLREQWLEMEKFKENKSLAGQKGNAVRWHSDRPASASAFASASALKTKEEKPLNLKQTLSCMAKEKSIPRPTPSKREFVDEGELEAIKQRQRNALRMKHPEFLQ